MENDQAAETPGYWKEQLSPEENATLKQLRVVQDKAQARRDAINLPQKAVHDWIKKSINADYAERMVMPIAQQEANKRHFNANPLPTAHHVEVLEFRDGVKTFKDTVTANVLEGLYQPSGTGSRTEFSRSLDYFLDHGGFLLKERTAREVVATQAYSALSGDAKARMDLMLGLVEAETGFYNITEDQYRALQKVRLGEGDHLPRAYDKIQQARPLAILRDMPFSDFQAIVANVNKEMGLPTKLPGTPNNMLVLPDGDEVRGWIQKEFDRLDKLPKPEPKVTERLLVGKKHTPYGKLGAALEELQASLDPNNEEQQTKFAEVIKNYNQVRPQTNQKEFTK